MPKAVYRTWKQEQIDLPSPSLAWTGGVPCPRALLYITDIALASSVGKTSFGPFPFYKTAKQDKILSATPCSFSFFTLLVSLHDLHCWTICSCLKVHLLHSKTLKKARRASKSGSLSFLEKEEILGGDALADLLTGCLLSGLPELLLGHPIANAMQKATCSTPKHSWVGVCPTPLEQKLQTLVPVYHSNEQSKPIWVHPCLIWGTVEGLPCSGRLS